MQHPASAPPSPPTSPTPTQPNPTLQEAWPAEWERELYSLRTGSAYLSDVHAYVLANVLRRPLLVYGDRQVNSGGSAAVGQGVVCGWVEWVAAASCQGCGVSLHALATAQAAPALPARSLGCGVFTTWAPCVRRRPRRRWRAFTCPRSGRARGSSAAGSHWWASAGCLGAC